MFEVVDDESGESIGLEQIGEMPVIELGESEFDRPRLISAWLTERSRELIPQTTESILEGIIRYSYRR